MANPTAVNVGIGFQVQDIAPTRGQIASFMRDVKASITDVERFAEKQKIGEALLKKGDIDRTELDRTLVMYRQKYNIIDEGEKRIAEYQAHKQAMVRREEDSMMFFMNLNKTRIAMEQEANTKRLAEIAAEKKAEEDSMMFLMNLNKTRIAMEQEANTKRLAEIAAEKKAEEDSMMFLMNLNKTRIAMEQEANTKRLAEIAAEKKAEEDSMMFLMNLNKTRIAMEQEKHARVIADNAAEKLAEENSMIFLMELRKQQRIDEEQRHAKKLAAIAAEKQAEQTLGIGAYGSASAGPRASSMAVDVVTGKIIEQKKEVSSLEQLVGTLQTSFASASTASTSNIDLVTGQLIKQKQEILTLEQAVLRYANASSKIRAEYAGIDLATGRVIQQKQEVLSLDDAINKLENDHAADVKRHAEQNAAREKQLHQEEIARRKQAEQVHSQAIRKRQDEQRQADRDRFRSLLDQAKTHKQIVAESDRFIERMRQQYNLSDKLVKKLKEIERSRIDGGGRGVGGSGMAGGLTRNLGQFGTGVMAGFGVAGITSAASQAGQALGDFIADSVKLAMERQRISAAMEAMLGSEEAAQKLTKAMIQLDRQSMLTYGTISKGAQTLLGFGVAQEMVMPSLQALSKISLGNEQRFQSLSLAFGQVAASGKLAGQEILQMVNAGFNPLQEIARVTGKTVAQLKADVEAGRVSFLQVAEAILTATEAGGRFEKISEKMLKTPAGMLAKLQSDFELIKADLGERLMPSMIAMFESIKDNEFVMETLATNIANLFDTFGFVLSMIQDAKNLLTMGLGNAPALFSDESKSGQFMAQWEKRQEEMEKRRAEQKAQRDKKQAEEEAFKSLPKEERKKRLAEEQAKMDEFRADQQRAKSRAEMQKKLQELEDGSDRARYFREIGGHLAKTKDQIKLINDAMEEYDKVNELTAKQERSQNLHEEINSLQEEYNRLKMDEVDFLLRKYKLDKQQLTKEEQLEKSRLLKAKNQLDQEKRRKDWEEFGRSFNPANEAIKRVRDIMLAVEYGFLDAAEATKAQLEAVKDLDKENQLSLENPKAMSLGEALVSSGKANKVQQNHDSMMKKLEEIRKKAEEQVQELKNKGGFAERN